MKPEDMCLVDLEGNQFCGVKKRTSEILMHLQIMKRQPAAWPRCIVIRLTHEARRGGRRLYFFLLAGGGCFFFFFFFVLLVQRIAAATSVAESKLAHRRLRSTTSARRPCDAVPVGDFFRAGSWPC